jgi:hypothetical protein
LQHHAKGLQAKAKVSRLVVRSITYYQYDFP